MLALSTRAASAYFAARVNSCTMPCISCDLPSCWVFFYDSRKYVENWRYQVCCDRELAVDDR